MKDFEEVKREERAARVQRRQEVNNMLKQGIKFKIVRDDTFSQLGGGLVVAERIVGGNLEVAFAFCHSNEQFKKVEGKYIAGNRLRDGNGVMIRDRKHNMRFLSAYFNEKVWG